MTPPIPLHHCKSLRGTSVALEPLELRHFDGLRHAAQDADIWKYLPIDGAIDFDLWWRSARTEMEGGSRIAFAIRRLADDAVIGSTSYLAIVPSHARVEIGWTWYIPQAQGTEANPETKLLLLQHAFDMCGFNRVELKTDSMNAHSRAAILKLGAHEEGILRAHMWMPRGYWRDTVYYSILRDEWPSVKAKLEERLRR